MAGYTSRRRPRHHMYDYNYRAGRSAYEDMLHYLDNKPTVRATSPVPRRRSVAEKLVVDHLVDDTPLSARPSLPTAGRRAVSLDLEADAEMDIMRIRSQKKLQAMVADADAAVAAFREGRPEVGATASSVAAAESNMEALSARTKRALAEIDAELETMGLSFSRERALRPLPERELAVQEGEAELELSSSKAVAKQEVSSSSCLKKAAGSSSHKRSVTYAN